MWGKPRFVIADNCGVDVRNLPAAIEWYKDKLALHQSHDRKEDDSGRPFADLHVPRTDTLVSLLELPTGTPPGKHHVIFYTSDLEKTHQWLAGRGVAVELPSTGSGGNRFFRFYDLEGNAIEVCVEPG